ncbi:MAG TPA: hypothetical protein VNL14_13030 [Candidatus Acidoferrales bacterium]|nr:hypothetical protein [Candidatus Acidoferrales bacterium]
MKPRLTMAVFLLPVLLFFAGRPQAAEHFSSRVSQPPSGPVGQGRARLPQSRFAPERVRQPAPPQHPRGPLLFGERFDAPDVIVDVRQTGQSSQPPREKAPEKKYYVPPRWVATDQGVEILMPGFWTDDPKLAGIGNAPRAQALPEY